VDLSAGQWIAIALVLSLGIGYMIGGWLNRRIKQQAQHWLSRGVREALGVPFEHFTQDGETGLAAIEPPAPFLTFEAVFALQKREWWPLWLFSRLKGKGDELILKASLRPRVPMEWEILPKRAHGVRAPAPGFARMVGLPLPKEKWIAWARPAPANPARPNWEPLFKRYASLLRGVSLRYEEPHLVVHLDLAAAMKTPAQDLIHTLQQMWDLAEHKK